MLKVVQLLAFFNHETFKHYMPDDNTTLDDNTWGTYTENRAVLLSSHFKIIIKSNYYQLYNKIIN